MKFENSDPPIPWRRLLYWLLLLKVAYLGAVWCAVRFWPDMDVHKYYEVMRHWPLDGKPEFASYFGTWDAAHYLYLSVRGYAPGVNSDAFYPLWPLLIRWFSIFTGGSHLIAGMLLANVFSLAAWVVFYQTAARRFGATIAGWALVFLIIFPGSIFYQFIYSEPLFFLLLMLLWFGLEQGRYRLAWVSAFLLPLSRGVGLFAVLPLGWIWLMKQPWPWLQRLQWLSNEHERLQAEPPAKFWGRDLALLAAPALGMLLYFGLMWAWTDNPLEGIQAQKYWGVHSISHLWELPRFILGFFQPTTLHDFQGSLLDRCMFIPLVLCLPMIWQLGKDMLLWTYALGIMPAMSGNFVSFTRFESTAFPVFLALAAVFTRATKRRWLGTFIAVSLLLHLVLLWRFVNFRWAG